MMDTVKYIFSNGWIEFKDVIACDPAWLESWAKDHTNVLKDLTEARLDIRVEDLMDLHKDSQDEGPHYHCITHDGKYAWILNNKVVETLPKGEQDLWTRRLANEMDAELERIGFCPIVRNKILICGYLKIWNEHPEIALVYSCDATVMYAIYDKRTGNEYFIKDDPLWRGVVAKHIKSKICLDINMPDLIELKEEWYECRPKDFLKYRAPLCGSKLSFLKLPICLEVNLKNHPCLWYELVEGIHIFYDYRHRMVAIADSETMEGYCDEDWLDVNSPLLQRLSKPEFQSSLVGLTSVGASLLRVGNLNVLKAGIDTPHGYRLYSRSLRSGSNPMPGINLQDQVLTLDFTKIGVDDALAVIRNLYLDQPKVDIKIANSLFKIIYALDDRRQDLSPVEKDLPKPLDYKFIC